MYMIPNESGLKNIVIPIATEEEVVLAEQHDVTTAGVNDIYTLMVLEEEEKRKKQVITTLIIDDKPTDLDTQKTDNENIANDAEELKKELVNWFKLQQLKDPSFTYDEVFLNEILAAVQLNEGMKEKILNTTYNPTYNQIPTRETTVQPGNYEILEMA